MENTCKFTPEMTLCEVSAKLAQLHDLLQIFHEMEDENAEWLREPGAGAGAIRCYLDRSEMTDSLMSVIVEKLAAIEELACCEGGKNNG